MRIRLQVDGASPNQVHMLTRAFVQTSRDHSVPTQITDQPTVALDGTAMRWTSPALTPLHANSLTAAYLIIERTAQ